jgi:hypothetical protein
MNKLETLRCIETTSQTQANNGTVCYHDPVTGCDYMSYESGYIRRAYTKRSWITGKPFRTIYQLNPTRKIETKWGEGTERVMIQDSSERLERLAKAVSNYRITVKQQEERSNAYKKQRQQDIDMTVFQDSIYQYFQGNLTFEMAIHEIKETLAEVSKR